MAVDDEDDNEAFTLPPELVPTLERTLDALKETGVDHDEVRFLSRKIAKLCGIIEDAPIDTTVVLGALVTVLWTTLKSAEVPTEVLPS